jgi:hypothetical protein
VRVLVRVPRLEESALLKGGPPADKQPAVYRRAGLILPLGAESIHDVSESQLAILKGDPRLDVARFDGDPAGYPKRIAETLGAAELEERRRSRRSQ